MEKYWKPRIALFLMHVALMQGFFALVPSVNKYLHFFLCFRPKNTRKNTRKIQRLERALVFVKSEEKNEEIQCMQMTLIDFFHA